MVRRAHRGQGHIKHSLTGPNICMLFHVTLTVQKDLRMYMKWCFSKISERCPCFKKEEIYATRSYLEGNIDAISLLLFYFFKTEVK
jgi:hypothetical protein